MVLVGGGRAPGGGGGRVGFQWGGLGVKGGVHERSGTGDVPRAYGSVDVNARLLCNKPA